MRDSEPLGTSAVDVGNSYQSLRELLDLPNNAATRILEGELHVKTAGVTYTLRPRGTGRPAATADGIPIAADSGRVYGPNSPWRLDEIWVRETVADAGATVLFNGYVGKA